ncbi:hypothetical protein ACWEFL_34265 [Streptomyces sp. NPDC004838]
MTALTPEEIRRGLNDNSGAPYGMARNARAEALSAAAEAAKDPALFRRALNDLIDAYEWSAERTKMVVPFARLLQEYDRDPSSFSPYEFHNLYWRFKWVAGRIVESPEIPLEAVDRWLADMERRYRLAGFSERAVRQAEFHLADATGDEARMERSMAGWTAADRDEMSDCHACELNTQGWFWSRTRQDAKAVEVWQPVLAGELSCMEEPHRVLAQSLLPLVRLGRFDDARAHHLRGYRLARGKESLLRSVGEHIEFCALTGNESRGLEILSEHASHLGPLTDVEAQMNFSGGILVLLRRLKELGLGDRPAALYQGTSRTADELYELLYADATGIAARFDARNGTALVSELLIERISRKPLVESVPLGVRSAGLPAATPVRVAGAGGSGSVDGSGAPGESGAGSGRRAVADGSAPDFAGLVERARAARRRGLPSARGMWAEVSRLAEAGEEQSDPGLAGDLLEYRAMAATDAGAPEAGALFARAVEAHRAEGRLGRAAHSALAAAGSAARLGADPERIRTLLGAAARAAAELDETDPERPRRIAMAELATIRIASFLRDRERETSAADATTGTSTAAPAHTPDTADTLDTADTAEESAETENRQLMAELEGFVAARAEATAKTADASGPEGTADVLAQAELTLARLFLSMGDLDAAAPLLASAAQHFLAAERPWQAVEPMALRASVLAAGGELDAAESAARTALGHAAEVIDGEEQAAVRLTLTDILLRKGDQADEAARHALDATHWLDQAGLAATGGARARLMLAHAYADAERTAEAAEVLLSALPDLVEHHEHEAVEARRTLGGLLRELHDPAAAAEQYLLAAETAKGWDDPRLQAGLAHSAAEALAAADMLAESQSAYARALELWRLAGDNPVGEVRVLRSLAWLAVEDDTAVAAYGRARALMDQAFAVVQGSEEPELRYEWAQTCRQLAQLVEDSLYGDEEQETHEEQVDREEQERTAVREEAVQLLEQAASVFRELGGDALREGCESLIRAAQVEKALGRAEDGRARLTALVSELGALDGDTAAGLLRQAELVRDRM